MHGTTPRSRPALHGALASALAIHFAACVGTGPPQGPDSAPGGPPTLAGPTLLVVNSGDRSLSLIDSGNGVRRGDVALPYLPQDVAISQNLSTAYVSNGGLGTPTRRLSVVDLEAPEFVGELISATEPRGLAVDSEGDLWVANWGAGTVVEVDPAQGTVLREFDLGAPGTYDLILIEDARKVYVGSIDGVSVIDVDLNEIIASVPTTGAAQSLAAAGDGHHVYVLQQDGLVVELEVASNTLTRSVEVGEDHLVGEIRIPHGSDELILSSSTGSELVAVGLDALTVSRRLDLRRVPFGLTISRDGTTAFVSLPNVDEIAVIDLEGWLRVRTLRTGDTPRSMVLVEPARDRSTVPF